MPKTQNRAVMTWIIIFMSFAVFLVVFGGFVRLTRSGLSIVEWNPVGGAIPPLNQQAWQAEFAKYQLTPEFQKVNYNMTLDQYREIFMIEWFHRIFARIAGFIFAIPFFVFVFNKTIPLREAGFYVVMGVLFLAQAVLGWIMVVLRACRPALGKPLFVDRSFIPCVDLDRPFIMDGPWSLLRLSSARGEWQTLHRHQNDICRPGLIANSDRLRRLHGRTKSRLYFQHLASNVRTADPARAAWSVPAVDTQSR